MKIDPAIEEKAVTKLDYIFVQDDREMTVMDIAAQLEVGKECLNFEICIQDI